MIWDRSASGPGCTCICEAGYESDDRGDCVACDQVCAAYDPLAVHNPTGAAPNSCDCLCTGDLMEFAWGESSGACRCITGAERSGDVCVCTDGYVKSTDGLSCVAASEAVEPAENCPPGTNCLVNPDQCTCGAGNTCDPIGGYGDAETFCSGEVAYVLISSELTPYERQWIHSKISAIRTRYMDLGYTTVTVMVDSAEAATSYLAPPSTKAIAYFGHATEPSIEDAPAGTLRNYVFTRLREEYAALGVPGDAALQLSNARGQNLGLRYAYIHTCHSADNMSLRDYLVASGGIYWGETGLLFAPQSLTQYPRP
jgi:hypothetical protein